VHLWPGQRECEKAKECVRGCVCKHAQAGEPTKQYTFNMFMQEVALNFAVMPFFPRCFNKYSKGVLSLTTVFGVCLAINGASTVLRGVLQTQQETFGGTFCRRSKKHWLGGLNNMDLDVDGIIWI